MFRRSRVTSTSTVAAIVAAAEPSTAPEPPAAPMSGSDFESLIAAARTGPEPALLVRLDGLARRRDDAGYLAVRPGAWVDQARDRFNAAERCLDPAVLAVASMSADGRVRERAVVAFGARPVPELMPFLVLRTADWVGPVRERACAALAIALHRDPRCLDFAGPMAARLAGRSRADFALSQVHAVLPRLTDNQFARLLTSSQPLLRRLAATQARRLRLPELVRVALDESDPSARDLLAEAAAREAVWSGRPEFLHRLAAAASADVRAIALVGLLRAGLPDEAAEHLADANGMVRATARFAARSAGIDALERYRALLGRERVAPGAVLGLAEATANGTNGSEAARELVEPYLAAAAPQMRAAAVTALRLLGVTEPALITPLLADPAPVVVRAVVAALETTGASVEASRLLELLADPARAGGARRALYRLCQRQHAAVRLAAGLVALAAAEADPKLVAWAAADLREMTVPSRRQRRTLPLDRDPAGQEVMPDLWERVESARAVLDPEVYDALAAVVQ